MFKKKRWVALCLVVVLMATVVGLVTNRPQTSDYREPAVNEEAKTDIVTQSSSSTNYEVFPETGVEP